MLGWWGLGWVATYNHTHHDISSYNMHTDIHALDTLSLPLHFLRVVESCQCCVQCFDWMDSGPILGLYIMQPIFGTLRAFQSRRTGRTVQLHCCKNPSEIANATFSSRPLPEGLFRKLPFRRSRFSLLPSPFLIRIFVPPFWTAPT